MSEMLPLFPLGTVLYPGLLLPLHIFEERYRQLVRDLLDNGEAPRFGVVAIREGRETGVTGVSSLYPVGCTAVLRQVQRYPDGRYDIVTAGAQRFRLLGLDDSRPYLQGEVELLPDEAGDPAQARLAAHAVRPVFSSYLRALTSVAQPDPDLPDAPVALSYVIAALMVVDLPGKQALLAEPDAVGRLTAERAMLARETGMLRGLTSAPAPELRYSPYSNN